MEVRDILGVEIMAAGTWNGTGCPIDGCVFTEDDLDVLVATFAATSADVQPPIKLGHTDDQKLLQADGLPAAGWLDNMRRVGDKILADLKSVPKVVADLMDVGAYRKRSVELAANIDIAGQTYPKMITAIALLGADLPAVDTLADIAALYSKQSLTLDAKTQAIMFTASPPAPTTKLSLPAGMTYNELHERLTAAVKTRYPSSEYGPYVSDVMDASVVFMDEDDRYWKADYSFDDDERVQLGDPVEVRRDVSWETVAASARRSTYADNAAKVLADLAALKDRSVALVAMRGRVTDTQRTQLTSLREALSSTIDALDALTTPAAPKIETVALDYRPLMQARIREAELSMASLRD